MLEKARAIGADEVVFDLEDAVAAPLKAEARANAVAAAAHASWRGRRLAVRVNAPSTPWGGDDLRAVAPLPAVASIVVPKVEGPADLLALDGLLTEAEGDRERPLAIQALIETAVGLQRVDEIAAASPRLGGLILGYADLAASLGRPRQAGFDPASWIGVRGAIVVAARVNGLAAIDGPYLGTAPDADFEAAASTARELGFDGKWAIHPSQVEPLNDLFAPGDEEIEWARRVVSTLREAEAAGRGAIDLDGEMIDEALRLSAERILSRAERTPSQ